MVKYQKISNLTNVSIFNSSKGLNECFIVIKSDEELDISETLKQTYFEYISALEKLNIKLETLVFSRLIVSDITNQDEEIKNSSIYNILKNRSFSIFEQLPLDSGQNYYIAYHIYKEDKKLDTRWIIEPKEDYKNCSIVNLQNYKLMWGGNFIGDLEVSSYNQTNQIFTEFNTVLNQNNMSMLNNAVRTWIYVRDVDNNYDGFVQSRKEYFEEQGLDATTRYIASTGIEGKMADVSSLVSMDSLSISNIKPEQIIRMEALNNMGPTIDYGVTFERGSKILFGDRAQIHISGTASIDTRGEVMHLSDIKKQTNRALDNIEALLIGQNARLQDMMYFIVYVRNIKEVSKTLKIIHARVSLDVPIIVVHGTVCRPTWLVEIEGYAVTTEKSDYPDFY